MPGTVTTVKDPEGNNVKEQSKPSGGLCIIGGTQTNKQVFIINKMYNHNQFECTQ